MELQLSQRCDQCLAKMRPVSGCADGSQHQRRYIQGTSCASANQYSVRRVDTSSVDHPERMVAVISSIKTRDELVNGNILDGSMESQFTIDQWSIKCNARRTHSAIGCRAPADVTKARHLFSTIWVACKRLSINLVRVFFRQPESPLFAALSFV